MTIDIPTAIGVTLTLYGVIATVAALMNWIAILQWVPGRAAMVPTTAACVILAGIMLSSARMAIRSGSRLPGLMVSICAMWMLFTEMIATMDAVSGGSLMGLLVPHNPDAINETSKVGAQSIGTAVAFSFIGLFGLAVVFNTPNFRKRAMICGSVVGAISVSALIGHALNIKAMYFYFEGAAYGSAMALPTALCLFLASVACFSLASETHD